MRTITLGEAGPTVSAVGFGTAAISGGYGRADRKESLAALQAALDGGITLLDGGDFYGAGVGELLIGEALRAGRREDFVLSIKYGGQIGPGGAFLGHDVSPVATKSAITYSLTRLGTDYIDIYRPARIEGVPVEETIGAIAELIDQGYVRHIALSEVGPEILRRAHAVHPIVDVQLEYSLISRGIEDTLIPTCRELGVSVTAYSVLSRGLLSGHWNPERVIEPGDVRAHVPRFHAVNLQRNLDLVEALRAVAEPRGATVAQLAMAWVRSRGEDIVPLIGGRRPQQVEEALSGLAIELSDDDLAAIDRVVPRGSAAGERLPEPMLAHMDPALR